MRYWNYWVEEMQDHGKLVYFVIPTIVAWLRKEKQL